MANDAVKIDEIINDYEVRPIAEARTTISTIADDVAHRSLRYVLTRHGKAFAAVVPISDLVQLHLKDAHEFEAMSQKIGSSVQERSIPIPALKKAGVDREISNIDSRLVEVAAKMQGVLEAVYTEMVEEQASELKTTLSKRLAEALPKNVERGELDRMVAFEVDNFRKRMIDHEREATDQASAEWEPVFRG